jgi:methionyl aminopeptidase
MTEKIDSLTKAGAIAHELHLHLANKSKIGANLLDLEEYALSFINKSGMKPSFKGFNGYPCALCLSVNEQIVHAIPRDYELKDGDVLSIDLGVTCSGWIVDTARSIIIGSATNDVIALLDATKRSLKEAIKICRPGNKTGDLGAIISKTVESAGFAIIPELNGHGVGRTLQEPPSIPNYGNKNSGILLKEGMVLAIEPITCLKPSSIEIEDDNWTIVAKNGLKCAHFEDTVYITDSSPIVLT